MNVSLQECQEVVTASGGWCERGVGHTSTEECRDPMALSFLSHLRSLDLSWKIGEPSQGSRSSDLGV